MNKLLVVVLAAACWTSTTKAPPAEPTPPQVAEAGGASYGGRAYGGAVYGGIGYASLAGYGGAMYGGRGYGYSGMIGLGTPPPPSGVPNIQVGQPAASGSLDKAIIRRYIRRNLQKLQYCYEKELLVTPDLKGTVTARFTIGGADGWVTASTATGVHPNVASCVATVIQGIQFPKPIGGGDVNVSYPFVFMPG